MKKPIDASVYGQLAADKNKKPLFLFPTETEAEPFRRLCPDAQTGISGVGAAQTAVNISRFLQSGYRNLVLAGIAGAYGDRFRKGDVVDVVEERLAGMPVPYARSYRPTEARASSENRTNSNTRADSEAWAASKESSAARDRATSGSAELPQAVANTVTACGAVADGADIENMEGAVFFALCEEYGAASREIRAVSNRVGEPRGEWDAETALRHLAETLNRLYEYEQD